MEQEKKSGRLEFLDCLRGFAILLVVFSHVWLLSFGYIDCDAKILQWVDVTMLPLFFFISGYVSKIYFAWVTLLKRLRLVMVPTCTMLVIYEVVRGCGSHIIEDLDSEYKAGYWFPFVLVMINAVHTLISSFVPNKIKQKDLIILALFSVFAVLTIIVKDWDWNNNQATYCRIFSLRLLAEYLPLYIAGLFASKYHSLFEGLIANSWVKGCIMVLFFALLFYSTGGFYKYVIMSLMSVFMCYAFVKKHQDFFSQETFCGRQLILIGKSTLSIYLIHYFLLLGMHFYWISEVFNPESQWIIISAIAVVLVLVIVYLSMAIRSLIALSSPLYKILLGK